jgi:hypothetical protein
MEKKRKETDDIWRRDIFRIIELFRKFHNIIVYIRSSVNRMKEFKDLTGKIISLNNYTRWNNWFYIFYIVLKLDTALDSYTKKHFDTL